MGSTPMYKQTAFLTCTNFSIFLFRLLGRKGRKMKLAEALILRADYQKKVQQLRQRLVNVAKIQEGETPAEEPQILINELEITVNDLTALIQQINKTNCQNFLQENVTIADGLATRDMLSLKRNVYQSLLDNASSPYNRYSRSEIKYFTSVNVAEIQKEVDKISKEYRELDTLIQSANWQTELIDN